MRQRSTIASTVGTADLRRPQDWSTLSRAAQFVIITTCMLWAPSTEQTVVRFIVGGPEATNVANALRDQVPTRWMQTNELQEKDLTRKMLRIKALETLGGWYSATRDEQQFMVSAWGAKRPGTKKLDLENEQDVLSLVKVLKQVSPEYRDSGAYATAQRFKFTPAEIASHLDGDDRSKFIATNKEAIMKTASMIGYETERVSSSTPSNDEVVREFLKETIEFDDHVISRGWLWSWKQLVERRDRKNGMNNWDRIVELFNGANRSVFTKLPEDTPPAWRSDWKWEIPGDAWVATTEADRKLDGVLFQHDHHSNSTYRHDGTVELKLTTVMFVEYGGGSSKSTVDTTKHTRSIARLCIPSLLEGTGAPTRIGDEYRYQIHADKSLSFIQVFESFLQRALSAVVGKDDLVANASKLYQQYLDQYVGGTDRIQSDEIPDDPYFANALQDCCYYSSNVLKSAARVAKQLGGRYVSIVNFPVHLHTEFMDAIKSTPAQPPSFRAETKTDLEKFFQDSGN